MRVLWLDPFHAGSHRSVAHGYAAHSAHQVTVLGLPPDGGWRWRMRGAALTFVRMIRERWGQQPLRRQFDVIVTTDMCDVATLLGYGRQLFAGMPVVLYMHENQLTYPLPAQRKPDLTWPWINYTSALSADMVLFNSDFHRTSFLEALPALPRRFHDFHETAGVGQIAAKAHVCFPGIDLRRFDAAIDAATPATEHAPLVVWNSRWDYDKQPVLFLQAMEAVMHAGVPVRLAMLGEYVDPHNATFAEFRHRLAPITAHWGFVADASDYQRILVHADIVVSAAVQEFFGIAAIEATYCGAMPLLPRRLAYPELMPADWQAWCLYEHDDTLVAALQATLQRPRPLARAQLRAWAGQFDWQYMAPKYDAHIAHCVASNA